MFPFISAQCHHCRTEIIADFSGATYTPIQNLLFSHPFTLKNKCLFTYLYHNSNSMTRGSTNIYKISRSSLFFTPALEDT